MSDGIIFNADSLMIYTLNFVEESQGTVDQGLMFAQTQACLGIGETQTTGKWFS